MPAACLAANPSAATSRRARRALAATACVTLLALAAAPASLANSEPPTLTITSPRNGAITNNPMPLIRGESNLYEPGINPVVLKIYRGAAAAGEPMSVPVEQPWFGTSWWATVPSPLAEGTYTARAEQAEPPGQPLESTVEFTVDTTAPRVAITYPANGSSASGESQLLTGSAGTAEHDLHAVTIVLYVGATATGPALEAREVSTSSASWSAIFGGLRPGTYTAQALQRDEAGNTGASEPDRFTLTAPPSHPIPLPAASFSWFPPAPVVGQTVVLVSGSTDSASPITAFSWDLAGTGAFNVSGPEASTSFATAGKHVVRLRVTDARGASSVATGTIPVGLAPLRPMLPFPIVRIAGVQTPAGVRLSLVSVQAPVGARVTVTCRGRGCRMKPQSRLATTSARDRHASSVVLAFRRFERSFRAGVTLEVRVSAPAEIGKYTLFAIHRHALPTRTDECLSALDPKPIACST